MFCYGLLTVVIMFCAKNATTAPRTEIGYDFKGINRIVSPGVVMRHSMKNEIFRRDVVVDQKFKKRGKNYHRWFRRLEPILRVLTNAISRYDTKKEELKVFYTGVSHCGYDKCGKLLSWSECPKGEFECGKYKDVESLKKAIVKYLKCFRRRVKSYEEVFQQLISTADNKPRSRNRTELLRQFRTDLRMLKEETFELSTKHKTKKSRGESRRGKEPVTRPKRQTDLMVNEWRIIQQTNKFLNESRNRLKNMIKCRKKIITSLAGNKS